MTASTRHSAEDLVFLRQSGFVQTADEIERLQKIEDLFNRMKSIGSSLNLTTGLSDEAGTQS